MLVADRRRILMIQKIQDLAKTFAPHGAVIDENFDLRAGMDSLSLVSFLLNVEDELNIEIDMEELNLDNLSSVKTFAEFLQTL